MNRIHAWELTRRRREPSSLRRNLCVIWSLCSILSFESCNIFETREAEPPSQSGVQYDQQTFPSSVISNLQKAISEKNEVRYIACFTNPSPPQRTFTFIPSADAAEIYAIVLRNWTHQQEQSYFQNLIARRKQPQSFSNLTLIAKDSVVSGNESRTYSYDYTLTFEHNEPGFTQTVRGSLQFTLVNDNSEWTISRWVDLKTRTDLTWSSLKGKFSN